MKVAVITDQHFGVRGDSVIFHNYFEEYYTNIFFPYLREHGITTIVDCGDTFDRRKYTNHKSIEVAKRIFFDVIRDEGMTLHMLIGNHDCYHKNNNKINAPDLLLGEYSNIIKYHSKPEELMLGNTKVLMTPWISPENYDDTIAAIDSTDAQILFGHLELVGFPLHGADQISMSGMDKKIFKKFDMAYSGHFHQPSKNGNIQYLGSPYEMTWSDFSKPRGFNIFDTETREMTFVQNTNPMFHKIFYNDDDLTIEDLHDLDVGALQGKYIKVVVSEKNDPYLYDLFISKIESSGPADMKVVDDHKNQNLISPDDLLDEAESTDKIMSSYIDNLKTKVNKSKLKNFITELYTDALDV